MSSGSFSLTDLACSRSKDTDWSLPELQLVTRAAAYGSSLSFPAPCFFPSLLVCMGLDTAAYFSFSSGLSS